MFKKAIGAVRRELGRAADVEGIRRAREQRRAAWDAAKLAWRERPPSADPADAPFIEAGPAPFVASERQRQVALWQAAWNARVYAAMGVAALLLSGAALVAWPPPSPGMTLLSLVTVFGLLLALACHVLLNVVRYWQAAWGRMVGAWAVINHDGPIWPPMPPRPR